MSQALLDAIRDQSLQRMWEDYRNNCLPSMNLEARQVREHQESFYAGAIGVLTLFDQVGKRLNRPQAKEVIDRLKGEANVFAEHLIATKLAEMQAAPEREQ
jgi:hypothetical protein